MMAGQAERALVEMLRKKADEQCRADQQRADRKFLRDPTFSPHEMAQLQAQRNKYDDQIDALKFGTISFEARVPDVKWLFTDSGQGGFHFGQNVWRSEVSIHGKEHLRRDAIAHRDEALRRKVVCRLEDRRTEMAHWHASMRFLEKLFALSEIEKDA
jgi:hypothetical protein